METQKMRWFSPIGGDGEITGDMLCEECAKRQSAKDQDGLALVSPVDPIKRCGYCSRPCGDYRRDILSGRKSKSFVKINGKIVLQ